MGSMETSWSTHVIRFRPFSRQLIASLVLALALLPMSPISGLGSGTGLTPPFPIPSQPKDAFVLERSMVRVAVHRLLDRCPLNELVGSWTSPHRPLIRSRI